MDLASNFFTSNTEQNGGSNPFYDRLQALLDNTGLGFSKSDTRGTSASRDTSRRSADNIDRDEMWRARSASRPSISLRGVSGSISSQIVSPQIPSLRWFGKKAGNDSSSSLPQSSSPPTPSSPSTPPSALREALEEDIVHCLSPADDIRPPPPAQLHHCTAGRRAVHRSPPFLENLVRTTLPTASVTKPAPVLRQPTGSSDASCEESRPNLSTPPRISLESLRTLRDRGMGLSSDSNSIPNRTTSKRWFSSARNLLDENDQAETAEDEQALIKKKYRAPKNPMVFCHGLLGFDSVTIGPSIAPLQVTHWRGIKEVLEARGVEVLITRVPATSSPMERAKVLEQRVSEVYPGRAVHLIGHSMGGLDCRYLTTHLTNRKFRVLSITTVASPHRGSSFADYFLDTLGKERIPQLLSLLELLPNGGGDGKAFESLTIESMRKFNDETPDIEGVQYFSWGAVCEPGLLDAFRWPHSIILEREGPNDGLVSVKSAQWGTYLGTLKDVNHLDLVGWVNTARYKWAELAGREIKFKPATFYLGVADHLARIVEGQVEVKERTTNEDISSARQTRAGEGVNTVEGVENTGPAS